MIVTVLLSAFSSQVILLLGRSPLGATSTNFGLFHFLGPVHNYCLRRGGGGGGKKGSWGQRRMLFKDRKANLRKCKRKKKLRPVIYDECLYFVEHFRIIMYYLWQCLDIQNHIIIINSHGMQFLKHPFKGKF